MYSTGKYIQYLVLIYSGKESDKEYICVSVYIYPCDSDGKESACNVGDLGSIPGFGRSSRQPTLVLLPGDFHRQEPCELQSMGLQRIGHD